MVNFVSVAAVASAIFAGAQAKVCTPKSSSAPTSTASSAPTTTSSSAAGPTETVPACTYELQVHSPNDAGIDGYYLNATVGNGVQFSNVSTSNYYFNETGALYQVGTGYATVGTNPNNLPGVNFGIPTDVNNTLLTCSLDSNSYLNCAAAPPYAAQYDAFYSFFNAILTMGQPVDGILNITAIPSAGCPVPEPVPACTYSLQVADPNDAAIDGYYLNATAGNGVNFANVSTTNYFLNDTGALFAAGVGYATIQVAPNSLPTVNFGLPVNVNNSLLTCSFNAADLLTCDAAAPYATTYDAFYSFFNVALTMGQPVDGILNITRIANADCGTGPQA